MAPTPPSPRKNERGNPSAEAGGDDHEGERRKSAVTAAYSGYMV